MITIREIQQQTDMFISPTKARHFIVENTVDKNVIEEKIQPENVERWKNTIRRKEITRIIKGMILQREMALSSWHLESSAAQSKWEAVQTLKDYLGRAIELKKHLSFYIYVEEQMIHFLRFISPNSKSRFYTNFNKKLKNLEQEILSSKIALIQNNEKLIIN